MIYFEAVGGPATEDAVVGAETALGVSLPADYRRFLRVSNGGLVEYNSHPADGHRAGVSLFFAVGRDEPLYDVVVQTTDEYPPGFVVIGDDAGGNRFLLATSEPGRGAVWFWDRDFEGIEDETPLLYLAPSFEQFLIELAPM